MSSDHPDHHEIKQGAHVVDGGVRFALWSEHAESAYVCLYDGHEAAQPSRTFELVERDGPLRHVTVPGVGPGQLYGFRVRGPYDPSRGHRFNRHKLLVDPYARAITGKHVWRDDLHFGYRRETRDDALIDERPNDAWVPKCVVAGGPFDWEGVAAPRIPFQDLVIYEASLKGVSAHRSSGVRHPGTYAGFVETIPRIAALGVNAVEFLPIHETGHEHHLHEKGLTNYWGYGTIGFFAPDSRFASAPHKASQIAEFKTVVRELHRAGIEVILDVVYNHTAEGDHMGPTFCFKGIDNASYYKRHPDDPRRYWDATGCGNTLDAGHPQVIRVVLDSLRMWAEEYRVDGFRFDLAPVLGRERHAFNAHAPLLETIMNDPVLRERKLIAEPWDLGPDGYRQGGFAEPFAEWNGRFRDTARRFIRGDDGQIAPLAEIVAGSSPVFQPSGRGPHRSIHFITSHDGFTLHDLVTYERKRNRANRERNNDGDNNNHSSNWGQEGPRADADILKTRRRVMKTFMTLLFASQGVPMIGAGDEIGRTQRGNNNAYCQDNAISWLDYERGRSFEDLRRFVTRLIAWRKSHAVLRRTTFLTGADGDGNGRDVTWYGADGREPDWRNPATRFLAYVLDGRYASETTEPEADLLIAFNAGNDAVRFPLPPAPQGGSWKRVADTAREAPEDFTVLPEPLPSETDLYVIAEHAAVILTAERP